MNPSAVLTTPCGDVVTGGPLGVIHGVGAPAVTVGSSAWMRITTPEASITSSDSGPSAA
jgi:hypothetical protein